MQVKKKGVVGAVDVADELDAEGMTAEGRAKVAEIKADTAMVAAQERLEEEDPHAKVERLHQNNMKLAAAIGGKTPMANAGQGPKVGDPGVVQLAEYNPIPIKV